MVGTIEDVSDRKHLEQELVKALEFRELLFNESNDALFLVDPITGKTLDCNQRAVELFEVESKDDLIDIEGQSLQKRQFTPAELAAIRDVIKQQGFWNLEVEYVSRKGREFWGDLSVKRIAFGGEAFHLVRVVDISDRQAAAQALQRQAQQERAFNEVVQAIRSSLELDRVFAISIQHIADLLLGEVSIVQYFPDQACWRVLIVQGKEYGYPQNLIDDIPDANNPFAERLKNLQVVQIDDTTSIDDLINRELADTFPGAWLLVPIVVQGKIWGSLTLARPYQAVPWQTDEVELAQRIADQLAIAIHQANLYQQLQADRERYKLVLQSVGEGVWDLDILTDVATVSARYWEILGCAPATQSETTSYEAGLARVHPDDRERLQDAVQRHLHQGDRYDLEVRVRHQDGHYFWGRVRGQAIWDEQGQPVRMLGTIEDVSDRKQIELALQESERRFSAISEISPAHIYIIVRRVDGSFYFEHSSRSIETIQGVTSEAILADATLLFERIHPDDRAAYAAAVQRSFETLEPLQHQWRTLLPSGQIRWLQGNSRPIRRDNGEVAWYGVVADITERQEAELALRQQEELLEAFFSQSLDGCFFMMLDEPVRWDDSIDKEAALDYIFEYQRVTRVNDAMLAHYGATREQFLGYKPGDFFRDLADARALWRRLFDAGHLHVETEECKVDGTIVFIEGDYVCLYDDTGRITGHFGIQRDITERKAAEAALRQREQEFRALAENSPDCIIRCDRHYRFLYINPVAIALTGLPSEAFLGKTSQELGFPEFLVRLWHRAIDRVVATGCEQALEYELPGDLGGRYFFSRIVPEFAADGAIASVLVVARDVTDLKRAQDALLSQAEREHTLWLIAQHIRASLDLNEILAAAVVEVQRTLSADRTLIFRLDADRSGVIIQEAVRPDYPTTLAMYWQDECFPPECYDFYCQGRARIVPDIAQDDWGLCLVEFMQQVGVQSKMVAPITQQVGGTTQLWSLLIVHACAERRVWTVEEADLLQHVADQLAIALQQTTLFSQLQNELHERQHAQRQLLERNQELAISNHNLTRATRLKDEFLAMMSHEIRTPMNGAIGMLNLLRETQLDPNQQIQVDLAYSSMESLLHLIDDILDFSKVEAGKLELEAIDFDLQQLLSEFANTMALKAQEKCLELVLDLRDVEPGFVKGDPGRLRQILTNLVGNAIKFTEQGEVVIQGRLQAVGQERHFTCSVCDTGIGIPQDKLASLFQSFTQLDASTTRKYGGTGLGLAIAKKLCELMDGSISVASNLSSGSCFTFTVCLQASQQPQPQQPAADWDNLAALVVASNASLRAALCGQLQRWGLQALGAADNQQAWELCQARARAHQDWERPPFALAIAAASESDAPDWHLRQRLEADPRFHGLAWVVLVDFRQQRHLERKTDSAVVYLTKPIAPAALRKVLVKLLQRDAPAAPTASPLPTERLARRPPTVGPTGRGFCWSKTMRSTASSLRDCSSGSA